MSRLPCQCPECQKINYDAGMQFLATRQKYINEREKNFVSDIKESDCIFACGPVTGIPIRIPIAGNSGKLQSLWSDIERANENILRGSIGLFPKNGPST
jgi:hypothetical protein